MKSYSMIDTIKYVESERNIQPLIVLVGNENRLNDRAETDQANFESVLVSQRVLHHVLLGHRHLAK